VADYLYLQKALTIDIKLPLQPLLYVLKVKDSLKMSLKSYLQQDENKALHLC
jgi:hypothetical protein